MKCTWFELEIQVYIIFGFVLWMNSSYATKTVRNSYSTFVSVFMTERHKGASAVRPHGILVAKLLKPCILSILVFFNQTSQYLHTPVSWLSS